MKLTERGSIDKTKELYEWCAETGKHKREWPEWEKYGKIQDDCFLCEYTDSNSFGCRACPYYKKFGECEAWGSYYNHWRDAKTPRTRKKYAKLCLEQLNQL